MMGWEFILKNQIVGAKQGVLTSDSPLPKKDKKECCVELSEELQKLCIEYSHVMDAFELKRSAGFVPLSEILDPETPYNFNDWYSNTGNENKPCVMISDILMTFLDYGEFKGPENGLSWVEPPQFPYGYKEGNIKYEDVNDVPEEYRQEVVEAIKKFKERKSEFLIKLYNFTLKMKKCPEAYNHGVKRNVLG
jgi:hypothetical protein